MLKTDQAPKELTAHLEIAAVPASDRRVRWIHSNIENDFWIVDVHYPNHCCLLTREASLFDMSDRLMAAFDRTFSFLNRIIDTLRFDMTVDKVEQLILPMLNEQLSPKIASLRDAEVEIHACNQAHKKAVTHKVNKHEAFEAVTAVGVVGASSDSTASTGPSARADSQSLKVTELS